MERSLEIRKKTMPLFIGIVGGSGAGKSWLAESLKQSIGKEVAVLSLDNFYKDRSHLPPARRKSINFDHPRAIDWVTLQKVLLQYQRGEAVWLPRYDFATHTVLEEKTFLTVKPVIIMEGLWLLRPIWLRQLFDFRIYVDCPECTRRTRRLKRDRSQRARTQTSISNQFDTCVSPMHRLFVEPQKRTADVVLNSPLKPTELRHLVAEVKKLLAP